MCEVKYNIYYSVIIYYRSLFSSVFLLFCEVIFVFVNYWYVTATTTIYYTVSSSKIFSIVIIIIIIITIIIIRLQLLLYSVMLSSLCIHHWLCFCYSMPQIHTRMNGQPHYKRLTECFYPS